MMTCVLVGNWTGTGYCFRLEGQRNTMRKSQDNVCRDQSWNRATPAYKPRALPVGPTCPSPNGGLGKLNYSKFMMMIIRIAAYHLMFLRQSAIILRLPNLFNDVLSTIRDQKYSCICKTIDLYPRNIRIRSGLDIR